MKLFHLLPTLPRLSLIALLIVLVGLQTPLAALAVTTSAAPSGPYIVASKAVNFRSGPSTAYPVVGAAVVGKQYDVTGRNADSSWLRICCIKGNPAWVARSVVTVRGAVDTVAIVNTVPPPPTPKPAAKSGSTPAKQGGPKWVLVADSAADFPGGNDHNWWFYLWTPGRSSFAWQDAQKGDNGCYRDGGGIGMEICRDTIKADPRGDIAVQWKASRGGTYKFEWDSPWLKFYKHGEFVGTQGKGAELPFSATFSGIIEWEMFFRVAGDSTPYRIKVYRLDETAGTGVPSQPAPAAGGRSEIGLRKVAAGVGLKVLSMQKTYQLRRWLDAAPGDIALVIEVEIENTGRSQVAYNPWYFDVQDSTGAVWASSLIAPDPWLTAGTLARGEKVRGNVAFVVPQTAKGFTVLLRPNFLLEGYQTIRVRLGD